MTDLELLNEVIHDLAIQLGGVAPGSGPHPLAITDRNSVPAPSAPPRVEIRDPAIRFFAEQLKPRISPISPIPPIPPINV